MENIEINLRNKLNNIIQEIAESRLFFKNPKTDFTRNRKLNANDVVKSFLCMNGGSLSSELYEYFNYSGCFVFSYKF